MQDKHSAAVESLYNRLSMKAKTSATMQVGDLMRQLRAMLPTDPRLFIVVDQDTPPIALLDVISKVERKCIDAITDERIDGELTKLLAAANALDNLGRNG